MEKFNTVTAAYLDDGSRARIIEAVMELERASSCAALTQALALARPG